MESGGLGKENNYHDSRARITASANGCGVSCFKLLHPADFAALTSILKL